MFLQLPGADYLELNRYGLLAQFALLLLFAAAGLCSLVFVVTSAARVLKHAQPCPFAALRTLVHCSVVGSLLLCAYVAVTLFSSSTAQFSQVRWSLVMNGILAVVPIVYAVLLCSKWTRLDCSKRERAGLGFTCLLGSIMTLNVIYWDVYRFW